MKGIDGKKYKSGFLFLIIILFSCPGSHGQDSSSNEKWDFVIAPYLYAPTISGEVTLNNNSVSLNKKLNLGGILGFEVTNSTWTFYTDVIFVGFNTDVTTPISNRTGNLKVTATFVGIYGMIRVAKWLDLGLGGRLHLQFEITSQ